MKVWILEKFQTVEDMNETLVQFKEMYESFKESGTEEQIATSKELLDFQIKKMEDNPNGYWTATAGKTIYRQFCEFAKEAIRMERKDKKFRVVEGEIKDDAKYWCGYEFVKENEGVLNYLMATK